MLRVTLKFIHEELPLARKRGIWLEFPRSLLRVKQGNMLRDDALIDETGILPGSYLTCSFYFFNREEGENEQDWLYRVMLQNSSL